MELVGTIALDSTVRAERFGLSLVEHVENAAAFPLQGRVVPEFRRREIRELIFPPYRIAYALGEAGRRMEIVRVWHAARGPMAI